MAVFFTRFLRGWSLFIQVSDEYSAHGIEAFSRAFVGRVLRRMRVRVIKIDKVNGREALFNERHMVVEDHGPHTVNECGNVQRRCYVPERPDKQGCAFNRARLFWYGEVAVADHVDKDGARIGSGLGLCGEGL